MKPSGLQKLAITLLAITGSFVNSALGQAPTNLITATMDGGTAKTGNTWYEVGRNSAAPTTGLRTGFVAGQTDPLSLYFIRPASELNALMLDTATNFGRLTFERPEIGRASCRERV